MTPQEEFERKVSTIFPDAPSSRLARACGGVAQRTAIKWLKGDIPPPADVRAFVDTQYAALEKTKLYAKIEALIAEHDGLLDKEVIGAQLSRFYEAKMDYKLR